MTIRLKLGPDPDGCTAAGCLKRRLRGSPPRAIPLRRARYGSKDDRRTTGERRLPIQQVDGSLCPSVNYTHQTRGHSPLNSGYSSALRDFLTRPKCRLSHVPRQRNDVRFDVPSDAHELRLPREMRSWTSTTRCNEGTRAAMLAIWKGRAHQVARAAQAHEELRGLAGDANALPCIGNAASRRQTDQRLEYPSCPGAPMGQEVTPSLAVDTSRPSA